jgi:Ca2+-binding EF-hand superfamily protein
MFDQDQDGFISFQEMVAYLTSVFTLLYEANPSEERASEDPRELAHQLALQCFESADINHDGVISLEEFKAWYSSEDQVRNAIAIPSDPSDPKSLTPLFALARTRRRPT